MKKIILLLIPIFLLTACTDVSQETETQDQENPIKEDLEEISEEPTDIPPGISQEMIDKYDLTQEEVDELIGMGITDQYLDGWVEEIRAMGPGPFDYNAILEDVTGGTAVGTAGAYFNEVYYLYAQFEGLPHPEEGYFYEGWIVRENPLSVISTGEAKRSLGEYSNSYNSETDLTDNDLYVLTLEPDDGDPAPAEHILEGRMLVR